MFGGGFGGTPTFGAFGQTNLANKPATSTFPGTGTSLFGSSANTGGFASATPASNVFGQPQASNTANIFGGSFNQPKPATSNLFGAPQTTTMFGQQRLPGTGTGSIFSGNAAVATVSPFSGGAQAQPTGTSIRFDPIAGNDTMMRNGTATPISTRNQCITCMKEYENKSLEELRLEDYQIGRKGPSQNVFGGAQTQPSTSMFQTGQTPGATSTFGQTSTFGGSNPSGGGLFNQLNQPKPQTSFFGNTNTTSGPFSNSSFSFGNTATQQPAGGSLFGNTATSNTGLGSFGTFPQTSQQQQPAMSLFGNKPLTTPATSTPFLGFNQTATSSTINKPVPTFGNTTSGFGTPAQQPFGASTSLFGTQNQQQAKPFSFPSGFNQQPTSQPLFGGTSSSFSFSNPTSTPAFSSGFGNTSTLGGGFPAFGTNTTTNFGNSITNTGFGTNTFSGLGTGNTSTGLSLFSNPNNQMVPNVGNPNISSCGPVSFGTTPYKDSPLFYNLINNRSLDEMTKPTNPQAQRQIKEAARRKPSNSLGGSSGSAIKNLTFPTPKLQTSMKDALFDGFEEEDQGSTIDILSPKTSVKKLNLKNMGFSRYSLNTSSFNASDREDRGKMPAENSNGNKLNSSQLFNGSHHISNLSVSELYPPKSTEPIVGVHESSSSESPADSFYAPVNNQNANEKSSYLDSFDKPEDTSIDRLNDGDINEDHPCGVKSNRVGYYLLPAIKDLDFLTDSQGNCFVKNFVIGRRNYGEIRFLDIVNVGNLDIDDIVLFRHKEVVVYPDDNNKPPVGEGINVPAEICLERVWPIDKITKDPIKVPSKIKALKYEEKLRRSCARLDAEFISYNEQKGEWVFRVKHFSKYSCAPEEEEDDGVIEMDVAKSGLGGKTIQQLKSYVGATQALIVDEKGDSNIPELIQRNVAESVQEVPSLPAEINYGGGDDINEDPVLTIPRETGIHPRETMDIGFPSNVASFFNEEENVLNYPDYFGLADAGKHTIPESTAGFITAIPSVKVPQHKRRDEISFMDARKKRSNFSKLKSYPNSNYQRGVPVAFGPNGTFLHILNQSMEYPKANRFIGQIKVNKIMPHREIHNRGRAISEDFSTSVVQQLSLVLESSCEDNVFCIRPEGIIGELVTYFTRELNSAGTKQKSSSSHKFGYSGLCQEELQLWKLCDILWPSEELSAADQLDEGYQIEQRIRLASWFKSNSKMLFGNEYDENDNSIMGVLKKGRHMEACELAIKQGNFNLALDLAQCCGESRRTMEVQMEEWERSEVVKLIPLEIRQVYRLCTGLPVWDDINLKQMTTSQWLQHFGIYLWYMCPMHFSIEEAVIHYQTYIYDCVGNDREVEYPSRPDSSIANTCVHLFKAYVTVGYNIRNVLNPKTNNPDCLDYKLSWFLMQNLKLFGYTPSSELTEDLTVGFAGQLESLGLFEWAVFVLKTLPECEQRNVMINRVLERNVTLKDDQESRIDFLEKYLGLSRVYVREHCFRNAP